VLTPFEDAKQLNVISDGSFCSPDKHTATMAQLETALEDEQKKLDSAKESKQTRKQEAEARLKDQLQRLGRDFKVIIAAHEQNLEKLQTRKSEELEKYRKACAEDIAFTATWVQNHNGPPEPRASHSAPSGGGGRRTGLHGDVQNPGMGESQAHLLFSGIQSRPAADTTHDTSDGEGTGDEVEGGKGKGEGKDITMMDPCLGRNNVSKRNAQEGDHEQGEEERKRQSFGSNTERAAAIDDAVTVLPALTYGPLTSNPIGAALAGFQGLNPA
jgi:hypothetical protein